MVDSHWSFNRKEVEVNHFAFCSESRCAINGLSILRHNAQTHAVRTRIQKSLPSLYQNRAGWGGRRGRQP